MRKTLPILLLLVAVPCFGEATEKKACSPVGVWYGGSAASYQMMISATGEEGVYTATWYQFYTDPGWPMETHWSGQFRGAGRKLEGTAMQMATQDPQFLGPPPYSKMADLLVLAATLELSPNCNTIRSTITFYGIYEAASIWTPGAPNFTGKRPLVDPPDIDIIGDWLGGQPIVETYKRLPRTVSPELLKK